MKYLEERIVKILMLGSIGIVGFFVLSVLRTAGGCSEQSLRRRYGTHQHRIGVEFRRQIHHESFLEE